jgi:hypothetical protein
MSFRLALEWTRGFLIGICVGLAAAWIAPFVIKPSAQRSVPPAVTDRPAVEIKRPPAVEAFLANLRTTPLLQTLEVDPVHCGPIRKRALDRCRYRAGDIEVELVFYRGTGSSIRLSLTKRTPLDAVPFAWAGLASNLPLLCHMTTERAAALARELPETLLNDEWTLTDGDVSRVPTDGAFRKVETRTPNCTTYLREKVDGDAIQATLGMHPQGSHIVLNLVAPFPPPHPASSATPDPAPPAR